MTAIVATFSPRIKGNLRRYLKGVGSDSHLGAKGMKGLTKAVGGFGRSTRSVQLGTRRIKEFTKATSKADSQFRGAFAGGARNLGGVTREIGAMQKAALGLAAAWVAVRTATAATAGLRKSIDTWTNIKNRVRVVTENTKQLNVVLKELYGIANRTRNSMETMAVLFQRVDHAVEQYGFSARDSLKVTEVIGKAVKITGQSAHEATGGIRQLTQAFHKGKLDGDEFRSMMETMPVVMQAIADEMGVLKSELLYLAPLGLITMDKMMKGLLKAAPEIHKKFLEVQKTMAEGQITVENAWDEFVGKFDEVTGTSREYIKVLDFLTRLLEEGGRMAKGIKFKREKEEYEALVNNIDEWLARKKEVTKERDKLDPSLPKELKRWKELDNIIQGINKRLKRFNELKGQFEGSGDLRGPTTPKKKYKVFDILETAQAQIRDLAKASKKFRETGFTWTEESGDRWDEKRMGPFSAEVEAAEYKRIRGTLESIFVDPKLRRELLEDSDAGEAFRNKLKELFAFLDQAIEKLTGKIPESEKAFQRLNDQLDENAHLYELGAIGEEKYYQKLISSGVQLDKLIFKYDKEFDTNERLIMLKERVQLMYEEDIAHAKEQLEWYRRLKAARKGVEGFSERIDKIIFKYNRKVERELRKQGITTGKGQDQASRTESGGAGMQASTAAGGNIILTSGGGKKPLPNFPWYENRGAEAYGLAPKPPYGPRSLETHDDIWRKNVEESPKFKEFLHNFNQWLRRAEPQRDHDIKNFDKMLEKWQRHFDKMFKTKEYGYPYDKKPDRKPAKPPEETKPRKFDHVTPPKRQPRLHFADYEMWQQGNLGLPDYDKLSEGAKDYLGQFQNWLRNTDKEGAELESMIIKWREAFKKQFGHELETGTKEGMGGMGQDISNTIQKASLGIGSAAKVAGNIIKLFEVLKLLGLIGKNLKLRQASTKASEKAGTTAPVQLTPKEIRESPYSKDPDLTPDQFIDKTRQALNEMEIRTTVVEGKAAKETVKSLEQMYDALDEFRFEKREEIARDPTIGATLDAQEARIDALIKKYEQKIPTEHEEEDDDDDDKEVSLWKRGAQRATSELLGPLQAYEDRYAGPDDPLPIKHSAGGGATGKSLTAFTSSLAEGEGVEKAAGKAAAAHAMEMIGMLMKSAPKFNESLRRLMRVFNEFGGIIVRMLAPILEGLAPILDAVSVLLAAFMDTLKPLIPLFDMLGQAIKMLADAILWAVEGLFSVLDSIDEEVGGGTKWASGMLKGMGYGAAIGTFIPGVGTVVGMGVGGAIGLASGLMADSSQKSRKAKDIDPIPISSSDPSEKLLDPLNTIADNTTDMAGWLKRMYEAQIADLEEELRLRAQAAEDVHRVREVATISEARERGMTQNAPASIKIINVNDGSMAIDHMATADGEKVIMNAVTKNAPEVSEVAAN